MLGEGNREMEKRLFLQGGGGVLCNSKIKERRVSGEKEDVERRRGPIERNPTTEERKERSKQAFSKAFSVLKEGSTAELRGGGESKKKKASIRGIPLEGEKAEQESIKVERWNYRKGGAPPNSEGVQQLLTGGVSGGEGE